MYEPIVLRKKQPRTIAKTPAAKVYTVRVLSKISTGVGIFCCVIFYLIKKKTIIAELDDFYFLKRKLTVLDEYAMTKHFWNQPILQPVTNELIKKYQKNKEFLNKGRTNISVQEFVDEHHS